jgi:superfamily II DNA or RNA helicase
MIRAKSLTLYLQQIGRVRRPKRDGSKAIVLDHTGNVTRHGDPSQPRLWDLAGRPARLKAETEAREEEERARRRQREQVEGQLREWNAQADRQRRLKTLPYHKALAECLTEAQLYELARIRNYHPGWVGHVMRERREQAARFGMPS